MGIYGTLVAFITWIFVTKHRSMPKAHKILFCACFIMFFIAVAHLALFMHEASKGRLPIPIVARTIVVIATFQFVIGDLILIWRVWVIWAHSYLIAAVPFVLMVLAAAFSFSNVDRGRNGAGFKTTPSVLIVINTSMCTMLIAGRIWYVQRRLEKSMRGAMAFSNTRTYSRVATLIVESGVLYAASQIVCLILDSLHDPGLPVMMNLEMPLIGILPTLIIVFVHFDMLPGTSATQTYDDQFRRPSSTRAPSDIFVCKITTNTITDQEVFGNDHERA